MTEPSLRSDWLCEAAELHGPRVAWLLDDRKISYTALFARVARLARRYTEAGLRPGEPVAVLTNSSTALAWAHYLTAYLASPLLPLDPRRSTSATLLERCGLRQLLCDRDVPVGPKPGLRALPASWLEEACGHPPLAPPPAPPPDAPALLVPTAGTTATPRVVPLTARNLAASARASRERIGLGPGDLWLCCLPLVHVGGLAILHRCARSGAGLLLHQGFEVSRVWHDLRRGLVTHLSLVPPMLSRLLAHCADPPPPPLRVVLVGGGPLSSALMTRARSAGWPVCPSYGLTEAGSQVATLWPPPDSWDAGDVGPPLEGMEVEILAREASPSGLIRVRGPAVTAGYLGAEGGEGHSGEVGSFTTSDLGRLDRRGHLHVIGRCGDVLVSAGENIHPQEVEERLAACPGIEDVAITAIEDEIWGSRLVAAFAGPADPRAVETWSRLHLPSLLRPRTVLRLPALPRGPLGKLDRRALRRWAEETLTRPGGNDTEPGG